jgi:hypothetical protein
MLERDPQIFRSRLWRGKLVPMRQNRILHPVQIARIVHMPHEVDVSRQHAYAVKMEESGCH